LAAQGVLSVNAAWTFTSTTKGHLKVHIAVWKRVMQHLILKLSSRDGGPPIVFLLLGKKARDLFQSATAEYLNKNPDHPIKTVYCAHPVARSAPGYFQGQNPLRQVNEALGELVAEPIRWWPARVEQPDP
jgi:uracil DNA glycosylase